MASPQSIRDASNTAARGGDPAVQSIRLRVRGADGAARVLDIAAPNEAEATRRAAARGFTVLAIVSPSKSHEERSSRAAAFPLVLFSQELLALLDAGLNLTEAMATLLAKERRPAIRSVLEHVVHGLSEGRNFSDVLAQTPEHFPDVYVATMRASERTGDLGPALARYVAYQLQFDTIRRKLVPAMIYPAMLLVVGGFVTLFLLGYVVPRMSAVYESAGRDVPWLSGVLLATGKLIHENWPVVLTTVGVMGSLVVLTLSRAAGRRYLLDQVLSIPWLARKSLEFRLARFYRAVSLLLLAGIALPRAMGMVDGLLGSAHRASLLRARSMVEQGQSLSAALLAEQLASPVAESLIKVGERSGQLAPMLERTARFQDDDLARWIDWASRLLEPLLMLLLGIVIGGVVVLLYMPIFELAGSLQ
jgi:general secretion pathway protein F